MDPPLSYPYSYDIKEFDYTSTVARKDIKPNSHSMGFSGYARGKTAQIDGDGYVNVKNTSDLNKIVNK